MEHKAIIVIQPNLNRQTLFQTEILSDIQGECQIFCYHVHATKNKFVFINRIYSLLRCPW